MKRTVPLMITALGGFVLIVAFFIPATENWGEATAVWFDILASIAFVLGGGNLLMMHLKKISDQAVGWGYSLVTLLAFFGTLTVGLGKVGAPPASEQENHGQSFASLPLTSFPESQITSIPGQLPQKGDGAPLPRSVRQQVSIRDDGGESQIVFHGWMLPDQEQDLKNYQDELDWQCKIERLFKKAQPPEPLRGRIFYYGDQSVLAFQGVMNDDAKKLLLKMSDSEQWQQAVSKLDEESRRVTSISVAELPEGVEIPTGLKDVVSYDETAKTLSIKGPMSPAQHNALTDQFPIAKPITGDARTKFRQEIESRGAALSDKQTEAFDKTLDGIWSTKQLTTVLDEAGQPQEVEKTACELLAEREAGATDLKPTTKEGDAVELNAAQQQLVQQFADNEILSSEQLVEQLREAGPFTGGQAAALARFIGQTPPFADVKKRLYFALLRNGPLSQNQRDFLLDDYRRQYQWQATVGDLYAAAHVPKYEWSGSYRAQGTPFWWLYEYAFKPLTATMFAMLAFYVASAAFRAFRAKNVEAILLLGTAFIILLGRTFAGVMLTDWIPPDSDFAAFRIENLTVTIMTVFNTAGNRAIMIGIALGIASTSLKVLLGVDRSYLGAKD